MPAGRGCGHVDGSSDTRDSVPTSVGDSPRSTSNGPPPPKRRGRPPRTGTPRRLCGPGSLRMLASPRSTSTAWESAAATAGPTASVAAGATIWPWLANPSCTRTSVWRRSACRSSRSWRHRLPQTARTSSDTRDSVPTSVGEIPRSTSDGLIPCPRAGAVASCTLWNARSSTDTGADPGSNRQV